MEYTTLKIEYSVDLRTLERNPKFVNLLKDSDSNEEAFEDELTDRLCRVNFIHDVSDQIDGLKVTDCWFNRLDGYDVIFDLTIKFPSSEHEQAMETLKDMTGVKNIGNKTNESRLSAVLKKLK